MIAPCKKISVLFTPGAATKGKKEYNCTDN
jgi:hypothetical protein